MAIGGDVFISYAREDKEFVRRLHAALAERGRDAWVDWEDIPLTADWWAEIQRGIDAADAFVFIISPDSARSAVCFKEIDYASQHNKRMVPILHRPIEGEVEEDQLHPAINAHNWIFIRDDDSFDTAFNQLLDALDTDLSYVREHTALLVRARAWENRHRDPGLLLRGQALEDAEAWLAMGREKERNQPTDLHVEYITRSRRAQNRRTQRNWIISIVVSIIIALAITSLVLFVRAEEQRQEAAAQREIAVEQRTIAEQERLKAEMSEAVAQSIGISAQAQLELFGQFPERGVLLALEVLQNSLYPYVSQAERALGAAVQTSRARAIYDITPAATNAIDWSPNGQRFVTVGEADIAQVWSRITGTVLFNLVGHAKEISSVDWSPNGALIATASWDRTARVWDAATGQLNRTFAGHDDWVLDVAWSPDGTRIATTSADGYVRIWEVRTGKPLLQMLTYDLTYVNSVAWSPDGLWLVTAEQDGMVRLWDSRTGREVYNWIAHADDVSEAAWSPDGTQVVTASWDETVRVWDVTDLVGFGTRSVQASPVANLLYTVTDHINVVTGAEWSPDGLYLLTSSRDRTAHVWDADDGVPLYTLSGHTDWVNDAAWSPDGAYILSVGPDQRARLWWSRSSEALLTLAGHTQRVLDVAWAPLDQELIATASVDRTLVLWNSTRGYPVRELVGHERPVNSAAWSPDGTLLASASDDRTVRIWDVESGETVYTFRRHSGAVNDAAWSPDGTRIASVCDDGGLLVWDALTGDNLLILFGHDRGLNGVAWSPDGAWIASSGEDGAVMVWDAQSGRRVATLALPGQNVLAAYFSPIVDDYRLLVVPDSDTVQVWALDPGAEGMLLPRQVLSLPGHTLPVTDAAWSPNGGRVVTVSKDRTALIWNAQSGAQLLELEGHGDDVLAVDWAQAGDRVATSSADRTAKTWRVFPTTDALIAYADECCAVRDLTASERDQFDLLTDE